MDAWLAFWIYGDCQRSQNRPLPASFVHSRMPAGELPLPNGLDRSRSPCRSHSLDNISFFRRLLCVPADQLDDGPRFVACFPQEQLPCSETLRVHTVCRRNWQRVAMRWRTRRSHPKDPEQRLDSPGPGIIRIGVGVRGNRITSVSPARVWMPGCCHFGRWIDIDFSAPERPLVNRKGRVPWQLGDPVEAIDKPSLFIQL